MLTLRIAPHKAPHKSAVPADYLKKNNILQRQIDRCPHKVGDHVWVMTNRGRRHGVIEELKSDPGKVDWRSGTQPFFIAIRCSVSTIVDGRSVPYGHEIVCAPLKKVRQ